MLRRKASFSLNRAGAGGFAAQEDVDPNSFLTNIADCMLVLMLGFLVALVARYNIELVPQDEITGIEVNMDANNDGVIDEQYEAAGTVYFDAETGKYYLLEE